MSIASVKCAATEDSMRCTRALIYKDNIEHNIKAVQALLEPGVKICAAVKADGYGCGAAITAQIAESLGVEFLAVAAVSEGVELRKHGIRAKIVLLSVCTPDETDEAVENDIIPLVFDTEMIDLFDAAGRRCNKKHALFLAVDTGMGRIGCYREEAAALAAHINACENVELCGMMTHFSVSDCVSDEAKNYTRRQFDAFMDAVAAVRQRGIHPGLCSCSSSAAGIVDPAFQLDMVRPGIFLYGYYPDEVNRSYIEGIGKKLDLKPVMQFETQVVAVKHLKKGMSVSYGRTWTAHKETDIAVLAAGYADGIARSSAPGLCVTINGSAYPICGRICMDQCMVDIGAGNKNVRRWDRAIFFGAKEHGALFDAADIARTSGTIAYEVLTGIAKRVPRVIV